MQSLRDRIKNRQRGFTRVELAVVIGILGLLTGIVLPTVSNITGDARGGQKEGDHGLNFQALLGTNDDNNVYLSELREHANDPDLTLDQVSTGTPALKFTGVNKGGDTLNST